MNYTVKFVDSETFDRLPYNKVVTSIGVADRNKGIAYVRDTGNPMDIFTAHHELEHLKGDDLNEFESPGEDGIYYKDLGSTFKTIAGPVGSLFGPLGGLFGQATGALMGGGKKQEQGQQQPTMNAFNPSAQIQTPQAPATSQVGGATGGDAGGGLGAGTIDKVRQLMAKQNQSGFYAGRDPGGV